MDTQTLETLIERRDESIHDLGRYLPTTLASVLDGHKVTLFDSVSLRKVDEIQTSPDAWERHAGGWGYEDVSKRRIIIAVEDSDTEQYFMLDVYFDSWDNGEVDRWVVKNISEAQQVPVEKYEWKVLW